MSLRSILITVAASVVASSVAAVDLSHPIRTLNYYEWTAVAPVVVAGTYLGENGRYIEIRVTHALRGGFNPGEVIRVDLKSANRERRRSDYPFALKLTAGTDYLLVLEEPRVAKDGGLATRMARSVRSTRELPAEGQPAILDAVRLFLEIQDYKNDKITWDRMGSLLEETNPLILLTALEQFYRFRRGTLQQLFVIRPLYDHPDPAIRQLAARVTGVILERHPVAEVPEREALLAELIGLARRDDEVQARVAAVEALAGFGSAQVETILDEIAATDPDQEVRYSAERILLQTRRKKEREAERPRLDAASN